MSSREAKTNSRKPLTRGVDFQGHKDFHARSKFLANIKVSKEFVSFERMILPWRWFLQSSRPTRYIFFRDMKKSYHPWYIKKATEIERGFEQCFLMHNSYKRKFHLGIHILILETTQGIWKPTEYVPMLQRKAK